MSEVETFDYIYEDIPMDMFICGYNNDNCFRTELDLKLEFPMCSPLEIIIMNKENYTEEEVEMAKKLLIEENEKLLCSKGRDLSLDYPDTEDFEDFDYTFQKLKINTEIKSEQ